jgi:hypothetical protein
VQLPSSGTKAPPAASFVGVTLGLVIVTVLGRSVPDAGSLFVGLWVLYVGVAWLLAAIWMGQEVAEARENGILVGVLVIAVPPVGVLLWSRRRFAGPVYTPLLRRFMVGFVTFFAAVLVVMFALSVLLHL